MVLMMPGLSLRLTRPTSAIVPSLDDWHGPAPSPEREPVTWINAEHRGVTRVAMAARGHQIPHVGTVSLAGVDARAFAIPEVVPAWVGELGRPRARGCASGQGAGPDVERRVERTAARRSARAAAVWSMSLSLITLPSASFAAPPTSQPSASPSLTSSAPAPTNVPVSSAEPPPTVSTESPSASDPRASTSVATVTGSSAPTTEPDLARAHPGNSATAARAAVDAAWEGVVGYDVIMTLADGNKLEGRVSAVQVDTFTLIDMAGGGVVRVMNKRDVTSVRVRTPPALPKQSGVGLMIGGGIMTAIGSPFAVAGLVFVGIYPSGYSISLPLLFIGGGLTAGGVAMLVRGSRARRAYNEAITARRLSVVPTFGRTRAGSWMGGLTLQF